MPSAAPGSQSRDRLRSAALGWRSWPDRPFRAVYDMVRQTMIDAMMELESRVVMVDRVIIGPIAFEVLREANRRAGMYDQMGGNQAMVDSFYGIHLTSDQFMDREDRNGDVRSDIRFLPRQPLVEVGPATATLVIRDNPATLNYNVIVGNSERSRDLMISYAEMASGAQPRPETIRDRMAQELDQQFHVTRRQAERMRLNGGDPSDTMGFAATMQNEATRLREEDARPNDTEPPGFDIPTPEARGVDRWTELAVAWES